MKYRCWKDLRPFENVRACISDQQDRGGFTILSMKSSTMQSTKRWQDTVIRSKSRFTREILSVFPITGVESRLEIIRKWESRRSLSFLQFCMPEENLEAEDIRFREDSTELELPL